MRLYFVTKKCATERLVLHGYTAMGLNYKINF